MRNKGEGNEGEGGEGMGGRGGDEWAVRVRMVGDREGRCTETRDSR